MKQLRKEYNAFREYLLSFLWSQWTSLGVSGHASECSSLIDPEALLLFSLSVSRYDARLFDEIADWLSVNGEFINTQRLATMQKTYSFSCGPQLSALAGYLSRNSEYRLKWLRLSELYAAEKDESLFFTAQGKPLPVGADRDEVFLSRGLVRSKMSLRGLSRPFPAEKLPSLLLALRAFMGVSVRCEMLCILAGRHDIHAAEAARLASCSSKTAQNALREMSRSGFVMCNEGQREKYYRIDPDFIQRLLPFPVKWIFWAPLYKALETLWYGYDTKTDDPLILSAHLRRTAKEAQVYFEEAKSGISLADPFRTSGEAYIDVFSKDLSRIVKNFGRIL